MDDESIGSCESFSRHIKDFSAVQNSMKNHGAPSEMVDSSEANFTKDLGALQHYSNNDALLNEKLNELMNISKKRGSSDSPLVIRESKHIIGEILKWYFGTSHVSLNDITPDISDAENVFVSADGLLINLYYSFGFEIDSKSSLQTLPYVYLFERFMNYLIEAGTKRIILIFLDSFNNVLEKINPGLPLLRNSLILHSKLNPEAFNAYHFTSWLSEEFQEFLRELEPSIFLIEDGSSISNLESLEVKHEHDIIQEVPNEDDESLDEYDSENLDEVDISTSLLSFALEMLSYSNIAIFYKMERKGQRITAFTYSSAIEPRFSEANKGIMRQNAQLKIQDEMRLSSDANDDFETCNGDVDSYLELKDYEYNIAKELKSSENDLFVQLAKSIIHNSISKEDLELSKSDDAIMHNIELILLFSKVTLLSGYLRSYKLSYLDRHYISNYMLEFKKSIESESEQADCDNEGWEFAASILKSLESLFISESMKQLRSMISHFEEVKSLIDKSHFVSNVCDLNDPLLLEFLFYIIGYTSLKEEKIGASLLMEIIDLESSDQSKLEDLWSKVSMFNNEPFFPLLFSGNLNRYVVEDNDKRFLNLFGEILFSREKLNTQKNSIVNDVKLLPIHSKFVVRVMSELGVGISENGQIKGAIVESDEKFDSQNNYLNQIIQISGIRDVASWEIDRPQETRPNLKQEYSGGKEGSSVKLSPELEKKRQLRDNQRKQQFWFNLGQILTGNDKLQQTIVVNPFHVWNKLSAKETEKEKNLSGTSSSSKAEEIRRKNEEAKLTKMRQDDENQLRHYEQKLSLILSKGDPDAFMLSVYDMLIGIPRKTNEFGRFRGLSKSFKLPKSRSKILIRTLQTSISVLRSFKSSTLPEVSHMVKARSAVCMTFRLAIETFNQYYSYFDKNDLLEVTKILNNLGFSSSASNLVESYKHKMESDIKSMIDKVESSNDDSKGKGHDKSKKSQVGKKSNQKKDKKGGSENSTFPEDTNYSEYQSIYSYVKKYLQELKQSTKTGKTDKIHLSVQDGCESSFQLRYMGADFERSTGSVADPRVPFSPDYWQKQILDIIDSGDSALVCAPTASGKTFICYYAMEQVLRFDNESVVVFIAPTKALADQVHAEIAYRFGSKTYPNHSRISLLCKLSRDYSINIPTQCQILITLPFMLELLLMSTAYQQWVSKIKFVIFDEVHCINEAEGGVYWERIFQLIPCPYLCLSATIGNPLAFYNWLQRIGKLPSSKVHFITYSERYADLSTLVYDEGNLYPLNPLSSLSYDRVLYYGLPGDFYLPPNDGLDLFLSLKELLKCNSEVTKEYLIWLDPQVFFSGTPAITKRQYRFYLSTLLAITVKLVQNNTLTKEMWLNITGNLLLNPSIKFQRQMVELSKKNDNNLYNIIMGVENIKNLLTQVTNSIDGNASEIGTLASSISQAKNAIITPTRPISAYKTAESLLRFIRNLQQEFMLPCIIFNMERSVVEHLGKSLIEKLTTDHHDKYYGSEEAINATKAINKRRQEQYAKDIQRRDMLLKFKTMSRQQREKQGIVIDESELQALENLQEPGDISEEYDPEFSFCDRKVMGGREREIQDTLYSCEGRISPIFIEGLKRGIGIHHDGLSLRYRRAVETLYRMGYLCIIISTRTLALGVNMPCRTTVFVNDSISLTPLLYRQASGRAGRRGYDIQGSVIFWDISVGKRNRLLTAELPTIKGNFPVTPTTVLRTFMLFENVLNEQTKNNISKERAVITFKALVKFFRDSLYSVDYNHDFHKKLTATQFRFIVDLLRRFHVLDNYCGCTGYAGLVSHMFEYEGTNLLLSRLIHSGVLFNYLFSENENIYVEHNSNNELANLLRKDPIQRLLILLAHVYLTKPMTRNSIYNIKKQIEKSSLLNLKQRISSGRIHHLLLSLPDYIQREIDQFNEIVFSNMRNSLSVTCTDIGYDTTEFNLPLSNINVLSKKSKLSKDSVISSGIDESTEINNNSCIQSPFISIMGLEDRKLKSSQQLIYGSRVKLNCTHDLLSMVKADKVVIDKEKENVSLIIVLINSFLVDFYESQRFSEIIKNNSIASSEIFFLISDFKVLLDRFLYSFNLRDLQQYQNLNISLSKESLEFYKNISRLTEILQVLYNNYRIIASKNDA
ncbi:SKI family SFII helicase [Cryptosporidium ubiquitum]|uniref:SKI family SFII helicase n=1 Tax=Cryptosporidium ubiquitum TaxID=857276 RepID=A0A1J4MQU2_9CRYT|nr:SKI family SFII helicase [Cryptosporidium ubiquitum]OII75372.1 SKI family SFII helicase [Cryptosporidium ubiquitum]